MSGPRADETAGRGLAAALAAAGHEPPVLVVAESATVGSLALAWCESFDEADWLYRVRVFGGRATANEIAALAAEARSLGARTIASIGGGESARAAEAVAKDERIPCFRVA